MSNKYGVAISERVPGGPSTGAAIKGNQWTHLVGDKAPPQKNLKKSKTKTEKYLFLIFPHDLLPPFHICCFLLEEGENKICTHWQPLPLAKIHISVPDRSYSGLSAGYVYEEEILYDTFPEGFVWGAATAAYQVSLCSKVT